MLVGKRPRPQMSRTTGMTRFEPDVVDPMEVVVESPQTSDPRDDWLRTVHVAGVGVMSPRNPNHRRKSVDLVSVAPFLKKCGLCNRRLRTGKDIYMYRGEIAFCSLECREQQIVNDERIQKLTLSAIKIKTAAGRSWPSLKRCRRRSEYAVAQSLDYPCFGIT